MQPLHRNLVDQYAYLYAGNKTGFSAKEITEYFTKYSNNVKPYDHYGINPTRKQLFIESLYSLSPKQQYYALNDLTWNEYESRYRYPDGHERYRLREQLHSTISPDPIGMNFSKIKEKEFREDWMACQTRVEVNPAAAITSARTLLETLLKTIINERGDKPDKSGELGKLLKQCLKCVSFIENDDQSVKKILNGLTNIINGLASISNKAGDRHGLVDGQAIDDPGLGWLCVNAAGTVGLVLIELHLFNRATS